MRYVSTRGKAPGLGFDGVLLAGLAPDGGLYLPRSWPQPGWEALAGRSYPDLATELIRPFVGGEIPDAELSALTGSAYAGFGHKSVAPLVQIDENLWLMELFHGPTLAFKDVALQMLGRLFQRSLGRAGRKAVVIGATSGDTGSAAIEALRGLPAVEVFILHPHGRISEVQRRQMTTVADANIHCLAVEGSFDDCQDIVKGLFADAPLREELGFCAVNSINWARIMAQIPYYAFGALALGAPERRVGFCVPTGNFGNVFAGHCARLMGLEADFVIGTNRNDILARFFRDGALEAKGVAPSLSPSMDIEISSNFERYLFALMGGDAERLAGAMGDFRKSGRFAPGGAEMERARRDFSAHAVSDEETLAEIARTHAETGMLIDPHSAVAVAAARKSGRSGPLVALATAHPAKFPEAVEKATGIRPALPPRLAGIFDLPERCTVLPRDFSAVKAHIIDRARAAA
jgi:threonine synthase